MNKIPRNKPTWGGKRPVLIKLQDTDKRNQRWRKTEEGIYHVLGLEEPILWKWYYPKNLQIQYNPCQTTHGSFHRIRAKTFIVLMEMQRPQVRQSSLKKEKWSWRN